MDAIKKYKEYYKDFNKKFFDGKLPDVDIKIDKMHDKDAVGEFNYTASLKHQDGKKEKFFDIKKAVFKKNATPQQNDEWEDIIADSYIAMPKDAFKKGKYYYCSILLHEMTHVWQRLVSNSMEQDDHGKDFRKKIDEINKKSDNEWRVGYEELDAKLMSDKPLDERPKDFDESLNDKATYWVKTLLESVKYGDYQVLVYLDGEWVAVNRQGTYVGNDTPASFPTKKDAELAMENFKRNHPSKKFKISNRNSEINDGQLKRKNEPVIKKHSIPLGRR